MSRVLDITKKGIWTLGGISITSCLCRNDYNIVFSVLFLVILGNIYNSSPKLSTKIMIHVLVLLIIADIIWIILTSNAWKSLSDPSTEIEKFWQSLYVLHKIVYVFAYFELILKFLLTYYLFADYKEKYNFKDLFNLSYSSDTQIPNGVVKQEETKGFELNFKNIY